MNRRMKRGIKVIRKLFATVNVFKSSFQNLPSRAGNQKSESSYVKAFTLLEVTIAMLLAGISISIAYTAYRVIVRSYQQYDEKNRKLAESMLLDKLLKKDFLTAEAVMSGNEGLIFRNGSEEIDYYFRSDYVLRDQNSLRKDTFFVQPLNLQCSFNNKEAFSGDLIDKAAFSTSLSSNTIEHIYTRSYSAEELMHISNNH